jgi:chitinase
LSNSNARVRFLTDPRADTEKPLSEASSEESGNDLHGCLEQLYLLKKQNRALKVLLSIGGWTYSSQFALPASSSSGPSTFASSAVSLVKTYGLDGVDVDWEYPANASQAADLVALLQEVRAALDTYGNSLDPPHNFTLTTTFPGPYGYQYLRLSEMDKYVDFWNFLAFDYVGPWSKATGNQANLFPSSTNPESTPFNTELIISYVSQSIALDKIVLGLPLYSSAFNDTAGLGEQFSGSRTYDFKDLPITGCAEANDDATGSSYCYGNRELISYDNIPVVRQKADFIQNKTLGGAMFWESSMDGTGGNSIIQNMADILGGKDGSGLDKTPNQLVYPDSPYDNILKNGPEPSPAPATTTSRSESSGTSSSPTPATTSRPESSFVSSSASSLITGASPSTLPANSNCTVGPAFYEYKEGLLCLCSLDISDNPVCWDPSSTCYNKNCTATPECSENEACMPNACGSGSAHCAPVVDGCLNSPRATEMILSPVD